MRYFKMIYLLLGCFMVSVFIPVKCFAESSTEIAVGKQFPFSQEATENSPVNILVINSSDTVVFDFSQAICTPAYVQVPLFILSDDAVYAVDFAMKFDPSEFTFSSLINHKPYLNNSISFNAADSTLRFSTFSMIPIENNSPLVSVRFNALSGMIDLSSFSTIETLLNGDDCSFKSINIPAIPIQVPGGITSINTGDSILLSITLPVNHTNVWSNGSTAPSTWVFNQGIYSVAVTNPSGCTSLSSIAISSPNPLPVELIEFYGSSTHLGVGLTWTTAAEINNDYFLVDSSPDGLKWKSLGLVNGSGTTTQISRYNYFDSIPASGRNYYRLQQRDFDGTCQFSKVISVNFYGANLQVEFSIYPNPLIKNSKDFMLLLPENADKGIVRIMDLSGKEIYALQVVNDCNAPVNCPVSVKMESDPEPGIYMIQFTGANFTGSQRLVVY